MIAICGSGTEVGKTHVGCALAAALARPGFIAAKPIESGYVDDGTSDAARLSRAAGNAELPPLYRYAEPVSPHLGARAAGEPIEPRRIAAWLATLGEEVLVETAGGLLSPLGPGLTNLDLVHHLDPRAIVLVACDRLGVLHDVRACLLALGPLARRTAVALSAPESPDASTGTNGRELVALGWVSSVVAFPRAAVGDPRTVEAGRRLVDACRAAETFARRSGA